MASKTLICLVVLLAVVSAKHSSNALLKKSEPSVPAGLLETMTDDCATIFQKCGYEGDSTTVCAGSLQPIGFDYSGNGFSVAFGANVFALNIYIGKNGTYSVFETSVCVGKDFVGVSVEVNDTVKVSVTVQAFLQKSNVIKKLNDSAKKMKRLN
mmetsp:Transcript_20080/g.22736  ORF Transcript_20080/g.22736 Transcript_20080/m.22736 type:complete len:154 (-) Transcript_20080:114-575(-)